MPSLPTVLVTGGAQRLGAALCEAFAQAGWQVLCHYQRSADAAHQLQQRLLAQGGRIHVLQADLADASARARLMQQACAIAPVQALVNNASVFEPDTAHSFTPALAQQQLAVNLLAPLDLARLLAAHALSQQPLARQGQPVSTPCAAIHILDQKVYNLNPDYFSYTVSKLALERAVALQAQALAPHVRVCGVAPGLMLQSGPQSAANFAAASRANLLRQPLDIQHVAQACVFLAGNPAITGSTLCVDNGQHLVPLPRDIMFVVDELLAHVHAAQSAPTPTTPITHESP